MRFIFTILTNALIISGALGISYYTYKLISSAPSVGERNVRCLALLSGFLAFIGAKALGIDFPSLLFTSAQLTHPYLLGSVNVAMPGATGAATALLLLKGFKRRGSSDYPLRLMILLATFVLMLFVDVYAAAVTTDKSLAVNLHLLPNLSFTLGMCVYIIVNYSSSLGLEEENDDWRKLV
jgi:hypothetical protein